LLVARLRTFTLAMGVLLKSSETDGVRPSFENVGKMQAETTRNTDVKTPSKKKLCLIIPTYNEKENILELISRIQAFQSKLSLGLNLIVVDDGSNDGTPEIVKQRMANFDNLQLIERPRLLGLGSAYLDGFAFALAIHDSDYFGEIDADLQHPPETLIEMSKAASAGADVVIASRYVKGGGSLGWSLGRRIVSKSANLLAKACIRAPASDLTSGFRIMSARAIGGLLKTKLSTKGYAFQIESLYVYRKMNMTFSEVPYLFEQRKSGETKLRWKEIAKFAGAALKLGIFGLDIKTS
jgi:dolichol-phosphate mannosyltransferase